VVKEGRADLLRQFPSLATAAMRKCLADPGDPVTFARSKLDLSQRERNREIYAMHRDLLRLRREDPVFRAQRRGGVDGAVLGDEAWLLRFFGERGDDRLLLINLGRDLHLPEAPEPLLAPPEGQVWKNLWCTEDQEYGGCGCPSLATRDNWRIPGHAAVVLHPAPPGPEDSEFEKHLLEETVARRKREKEENG
jgi:maltooligosyltrehalose trehalohydrolase